MRADLARVGVIGAYEPFAVPAGGLDRLGDLSDFRADVGRLLGHVCVIHAGELAVVLDDVGVLAAIEYEHAADEHGFRHAGVVVLHGLEALARSVGEAVEVQAVVPVGAVGAQQFRPVGVERGLARQEGGGPGLDRLDIVRVGVHEAQVVAAGAVVGRNVVVTVAGDAAQLGVLVEGVAAASVGDEGEEVLVAKVVNLRQRGGRGLNHIFLCRVIEMAVAHGCPFVDEMIRTERACDVTFIDLTNRLACYL